MENKPSVNLNAERGKFIIAVTLYGTIGLFLRQVSLPSEAVALCRGVIGSLFILLYLKLKGSGLNRTAIRSNLRWLLISGVCLGLNWIFLFAAYIHTTVAIASLCNYMAPIIVIAVAPIALREKLDRRKIPCIFAALLGIVLVSGAFRGGVGNLGGAALGLAAAVCFTVIVLCNRKLTDISPYDRSVVQLALSAITILPYAWLHNRGTVLQLDVSSVLIVLMLGLVHTGVAYCLYFSGMGSLPVQTVAILGYLEPVISVLCSALFLRESMPPEGWLGAALVIIAAAVSEWMPEKKTE